ncbi:MAG: lysophospholipid acyltransferase family protein [Gammaproteobacteria bacterium]
MIRTLSYCWRLLATGLCFTVFGASALFFGMLVFPLMRLLPGSADAHRRRVRTTFQVYMRSFVGLMSVLGVLTYDFQGAERLGRPGQMILANHPSLIDVIFLIGFTPQATCIVKDALFHNLLTRWPVGSAGYVSNLSSFEMVERASQALREGQNVIVFPEGTRTTPGEALQFHRGAASIAVKAAEVVTPVFIRCVPTTLAKHMPWYRIPERRARFTFRVGRDIDPAKFRTAPDPLASRAFNTHLLKVFADELKAPAGEMNPGAGTGDFENGGDAGRFGAGENPGVLESGGAAGGFENGRRAGTESGVNAGIGKGGPRTRSPTGGSA